MAENNCVVCFKNVRIYSVGECDHPVCYECSTRMRVLCRQNECPMCRHEMASVVFTEKVRPFRRLKRRYALYDGVHHIAFENSSIEEMYYTLLQHVCTQCLKHPVFDTHESLNEHMRRVHDLYCCDLCADNLKIFPSERRYYTKMELNRHRKIGDVDDRSHRGHPLCEFCNIRFMDRDELYRHLRKIHLFCHICDSEGIQQFYGQYDMLRDHYRKDHFLCEEGNCIQEQLTSVFPTEIDLKAHTALVHCKNLRNKQAVKQARTLELEFTLAPRNRRPVNHERQECNSGQSSQTNDNNLESIVSSWDQEFPSLTSDVPFTAPRPSVIRDRSNRLAFDEQNFPALSSEANIRLNFVGNRPSAASVTSANISVQMKSKKPNDRNRSEPVLAIAGPSTSTLSLTWVKKAKERRPTPDKPSQASLNPSESVPKPPSLSRKDFPKLQTSIGETQESSKKNKKSSVSIHIDEDDNTSSSDTSQTKPSKGIPNGNKLVGYSQVPKKDNKTPCFLLNASRKKVKMKPETFTPLNVPSSQSNPLSQSIPHGQVHVSSESGVSRSNTNANMSTNSNNTNCDTNINDRKIKKSKSNEKSSDNRIPKDAEKKIGKGKENVSINVKIDEKKYSQSNNVSKKERGRSQDSKKNNVEEKSEIVRMKTELNIGQLSESRQVNISASNESTFRKPPPGFDRPKLPVPPPGITPIGENGILNVPTFSTNLIADTLFAYKQPQDFVSRNSDLIRKITDSLPKASDDALNDLKNTSLLFREGLLPAAAFYEYCKKNLKAEDFDDIFTELIVLLPNITKQQELFAVHISSSSSNSLLLRIDICTICFQILLHEDKLYHYTQHGLNANSSMQQRASDQ